MSDTPETDAVAEIEGNWDTKALRMGDHARRMERERDEAIEWLKRIMEWGGFSSLRQRIELETFLNNGKPIDLPKGSLAAILRDSLMEAEDEDQFPGRACQRCGTEVPDNWPYGWCMDCQEHGKCRHGNRPEDCDSCYRESDEAYDASR